MTDERSGLLPPWRPARRFDDEQAREVAERYRAGESTQRIAEVYGTTSRTVWKTLLREGVQLRPRRGGKKRAS